VYIVNFSLEIKTTKKRKKKKTMNIKGRNVPKGRVVEISKEIKGEKLIVKFCCCCCCCCWWCCCCFGLNLVDWLMKLLLFVYLVGGSLHTIFFILLVSKIGLFLVYM